MINEYELTISIQSDHAAVTEITATLVIRQLTHDDQTSSQKKS